MSRIGFIGLGNMGTPMAVNLARAGHELLGFDVSEAACQGAREAGIAVAADMAAAVREAEIVITMLPDGRLVLGCYRGPLGLLETTAPGTLLIDCSTIDVADARAAIAAAVEAGRAALDAPVSGGVGGATQATLTFMAGGTGESFARARPVLEAMGRRIVHCGDAGAGQAAKICNNMILGISMIAVGEAFVLAETLGLSHQALYDVASAASGQCWALTSNCPVPGPLPASPANRDYKPGFAASLMLKDMRLSQAAATSFGADTTLGREATALFERYVDAGGGGMDFSAIIQDIRTRSGGQHD